MRIALIITSIVLLASSPCADTPEPSDAEQSLLKAFHAIAIMHIDYRQVIRKDGIEAVFQGPMLFVQDDNGGQFHIYVKATVEEQSFMNREMECLYANGVFHVTDFHEDVHGARRADLDPTEMTAPGGPLVLEEIRKNYDLVFEESDDNVRVSGSLKEGAEPVIAYATFKADFDAKTGLLKNLDWLGGPNGSTATVTYTNPDFDPDWDPNRLIFEPPPDFEVHDHFR